MCVCVCVCVCVLPASLFLALALSLSLSHTHTLTHSLTHTHTHRDLLKHIRWPEFQREMLSEMFVNPDPSIGDHIQTMVIESLAWANFSLDARRVRCLESDTARHPKYLPRHSVFPRQVHLLLGSLSNDIEALRRTSVRPYSVLYIAWV